jgi:hypothetical protein
LSRPYTGGNFDFPKRRPFEDDNHRTFQLAGSLKTVILLSVLGGILVAAGYLIGGPRPPHLPVPGGPHQYGRWFFSDKIALAAGRSLVPGGGPTPLPDGPT